jgi:cell division protein FtsZ
MRDPEPEPAPVRQPESRPDPRTLPAQNPSYQATPSQPVPQQERQYPAPTAPQVPSNHQALRPPVGHNGSLPSRAVPVTEDPDDEVDVPPFMRR